MSRLVNFSDPNSKILIECVMKNSPKIKLKVQELKTRNRKERVKAVTLPISMAALDAGFQ